MLEPHPNQPVETFGSYQLFECLGRGGMATVHRAKKNGIEGFARPVALKRLLPQLTADPDYLTSFVREARLAGLLRHVNIAQTYDLGKIDDTYYIAMELVPGRDLRQILRQCHRVVGPMPVPAVVHLLYQLCDALDYAHTFRDERGQPLGIVHRDISPANIIIDETGTAKLVDFGVAKSSNATLSTSSGLLKGKFAYMAPELLQGQIDPRCDLFAIGVVAWELLTATPLFAGGDDMEILQRITGWDPPPPSTHNPMCPPELDRWIATALAKRPHERFQSAAHMRDGLDLVARSPAQRATSADLAGWIRWAFDQQPAIASRASAELPTASMTIPHGVTVTVAPPANDPDAERARTRTTVGVSPLRNRPPSQPASSMSPAPSAAASPSVPIHMRESIASPRANAAIASPVGQRPNQVAVRESIATPQANAVASPMGPRPNLVAMRMMPPAIEMRATRAVSPERLQRPVPQGIKPPPPRRTGREWAIILFLCAAAAVGGFFFVHELL